MYEILFTKKAEKNLKKLAHSDRIKIIDKIEKLDFPFPRNLNIESIVKVKGFYRLRLGKLRAIFEIDRKKKKIWIRKVGYRGGIYGMF